MKKGQGEMQFKEPVFGAMRNLQQKRKQLELRFQRDTPSGFKLLAHSKRSIQEIFVVVTESKKEEVKNEVEIAKG